MKISIVIPAYNEAASLPQLHAELKHHLDAIACPYEVIFIDDGSTDETPRILESLSNEHACVRAFRLPRNLGKSAAYRLGFAQARGSVLLTLDADLQDDPAEIEHLLQHIRSGTADLVVGWKQHRLQNEPGKALPSRVFNMLLSMLFGLRLHDANCGFRAMRAEIAPALQLQGDYYRFIPQMAHLKGYRVIEHPVHHRRRQHGASKYGWSRFVTGLLDALSLRFTVSFSQKPLHAFAAMSLPFFSVGAMLEAYVLWRKLVGEPFLEHLAALSIGVLCLVVGVQILSIGLVGVLISAAQGPEGPPSHFVVLGRPQV